MRGVLTIVGEHNFLRSLFVLAGSPKNLAAAKLGLVLAPYNPTDQSVFSDVTEPTATGYGRVTIDASFAEALDPDGHYRYVSSPVSFGVTTSGGTDIVVGWALFDTSHSSLFGGGLFTTSHRFNQAGDEVTGIFITGIDKNGNFYFDFQPGFFP